ncbi:DEAD/DEAH box helicase [Gordonia jinhuaensis]|uniref:DEAD/DEAH box helicase n=1 Tax=Gordonia jinhuaensis TaxID=1517702 RepID=A0A916T2M6_9ACTN|nr:DEAD/DEAH box helicase [Gordonia jinhuaensis]GGB25914.1 DEAD/DEAH box helicase [Gordonia jinhuaensis]
MTAEPLVAAVDADADTVFDRFTDWWSGRGIELYPAQEEALIELVSGDNVILSTPTGSGKSLVASGAIFAALSRGERSFYTAPIKALVSEKFFDLCEQFGADNVGMLTGDAAVNTGAPIICATAEILANIALREGDSAPVGLVVMDEFHYYGESDRGWAWQVPLIELPHAQFLLMSATLGDVDFFVDDLTRRTGRTTTAITGTQRPVPLSYDYVRTPVHETIETLIADKQAPVYVVHFTQAAAVERAQALLSANICTREERDAIAEAIGDFRFSAGFGKTLSKLVRAGIGVHHAGMLPRYRRLVERLAQQGLLRVIAGTDTLGVGVNVPIRTVLFTGLTKFDGNRVRHLRAREFHQIAGRAGRAGFDTEGFVVAQAPEHDVENARAEAKVAADPKRRKKITKKKAPEGFVSWGEGTFEKLIAAPPEPLRSHFRVSTAMIMDVIARPGDCFAAMRHLLEDNHEPRERQRRHILHTVELYRGLLDAGIVVRRDPSAPSSDPRWDGKNVELTADLPDDIALTRPLSEFALAAFELLDADAPDHALDVISVIEATVDDPRPVLMAQRSAARDAAMAEMKADGVEYEERMAELAEITWPMPLADLIDAGFTIYRSAHPWVSSPPSPKSVLRMMIEEGMDFNDLIARFSLARSEGVVLRYLTDVYRVLRQGLPSSVRDDEIDEITAWLGQLIRGVDSSLIDEWDALIHPGEPDAPAQQPRFAGPDVRGWRRALRTKMFQIVVLLAREDYTQLRARYPDVDWEDEFDEYFAEYDSVGAGPDARGPALFGVDESGDEWHLRQTIDDPAGDHGWAITARADAPTTPDAEPELRDVAIIAG